MNFGQLKTKVADWLNRSDLTSAIPDFVNMAKTRLEREWNYRGMEAWASVAISNTGSNDDAYITMPTRYKETKFMKILYSSQYYPVNRTSEDEVLKVSLSTRSRPENFASIYSTEEFLLSPSPDTTYTVEATHYVYSADFSADADTNWWTEDAWDCLLYGALLEAAPYLVDKERIGVWGAAYTDKVKLLRDSQISETRGASANRVSASFVV